jgi:hypothetical protein
MLTVGANSELKAKAHPTLAALFESCQGSPENDGGCSQPDTIEPLSDELWRAEAASGIIYHSLRRLLGKLIVLLETVSQKNFPRLRFFPAILRVQIVLLRLLRALRTTYFRYLLPNFYAWCSIVSFFDVPCSLNVLLPMNALTGPIPQRLILRFLPLMIIFLILLFLTFPGSVNVGSLEAHMTPARIRRLQKNVCYHSQ